MIGKLKTLTWLLFLLSSPGNYIKAQNTTKEIGSWNIINVKMNLDKQWSFFVEPQLRSLSFYNQFHYYEIKGGITYNLKSNFSFTTGVGSYNTYSQGGNFKLPYQQKEIRTWVQLIMKQQVARIKFEHRYRAEQRFTNNGFRNRFRYRLNTAIPLNNKKLVPKTFYASIWNEIFFTDKAPYFERNRFFVGGGYEVSEAVAIQSGYLHQFDYKINDETGRNFFQISLLLNVDLKKKHQEFSPSTLD